MKKLIFILMLGCGGFASAQDHLFSPANRFRGSDFPVTFSLGFKSYESLGSSLSVYSPTSMRTEQYVPYGNGYSKVNAAPLPMTLNGITTDSFNPNGTTDMKSALGMGLIRTIFKL
ncbi:hypothetical protein [Flavobacterium sp.]|uniref:hypothetical protein n=1 Tax=Flavobacterium sp. TaxID=239 RepID=UPI0039E5DAFB